MRIGLFMSKIEFNFYTRLKSQKSILLNNISEKIKKSSTFQNLKNSKIIRIEQKVRGARCYIEKLERYDSFYIERYPNAGIDVKNEIDNQLKYRNTKATTVEKERVILIRGFHPVEINGKIVNLQESTENFGVFSAILKSLRASKICFIENLQPFLEAEKVIDKTYIYIHFYGRFPKERILKKIECDEYLHFSDYDFVGMHEYLRAKKIYDNAVFYLPNNYNQLYTLYSTPRKKKDTIYKNVKESTLAHIVKIREEIKDNNRFLEQQVVMGEL